jgi:predicted ATPase
MFTEVQIENYKSIQSLKINLGRVNVFIGENGCGKSNILEAIALAGAAAGNKLDNEFLAPRGIRVTEPEFMRSAFDKENISKEIKINLKRDEKTILKYVIQNDNQAYSNWSNLESLESYEQVPDVLKEPVVRELFIDFLIKYSKKIINISPEVSLFGSISQKETNFFLDENINQLMTNLVYGLELKSFLIYSPENSWLRTFEGEGQIQPLAINGQGLFKLIKVLSNSLDKINEIRQRLELIDWFDDFKLHQDSDIEKTIQIKDRYLDKELPYFNQRSSNEGFLFLMFYFALFVSDDTPKFFAIDNIENSLNPKLCTRLIQELVELAKKYDKQVIFTTHNPAILDGLDLHDDDQRLFTIYRNIDGHTKAKRVYAPEPLEDDDPVPLSEAFMNGYIGGLPNNF